MKKPVDLRLLVAGLPVPLPPLLHVFSGTPSARTEIGGRRGGPPLTPARARGGTLFSVARRWFAAGLPLLASVAVVAAGDEEGFKTIFDGRTFTGWQAPDMSYWSIEDGAITGKITKEHPCTVNQYIVWQGGELADFELKLRSRVNGEGGINNGFQFRSRLLPDGDIAGYQVDNNLKTDWLVRLYDEFGRHTLAWRGQRTAFDENGQATHAPIAEATGPAAFRLEEWHEYHLICQGSHLTLRVNGQLMAEVIDHDPRRSDAQGVLGLQLHSGPPTMAQFKDIRLKILKPAAAAARGKKPRAEEKRDQLLRGAMAHWDLGVGGHGVRPPLRQVGDSELNVRADGPGAIPGARVAVMRSAYFDAGKELNVPGSAVTAFLRARDPSGKWNAALFAKRGGHDRVNCNLYSIGGVIGFEVHTDAGFVGVSFPASEIAATAWHDFAGRYDGQAIELICDGQVMARKIWKGGNLTQNTEPLLLGAETDAGKIVRAFTGEMEEAALWSRALSDSELALLMRKKAIKPDVHFAAPYTSPIHFRPKVGRLADTIPFFWKGEYHIFYLRAIDKVPWEHIVSTDLVHWKELPTALVADGDANGPDGQHMFTGSVIERDGTFHIFYTGWNPRNPAGLEFVMHATSPDLLKWTKHPEDIFGPDGVLYANKQQRDFRDPYVFWNEPDKRYWMFLCTGSQTGVAVSADLKKWELQKPLDANYAGLGTPECPDYFTIAGTHYLICSPTATGSTYARYAKGIRGPYLDPVSPAIDTPILYAAKRLFDGKRHVITGWIRDLGGERDGGGFEWGGTQCVPREVMAGPNGQLHFRPVPEATAVFTRTVLDLSRKPKLTLTPARWCYEGSALVGEASRAASQMTLAVPDNYLFECNVKLDERAVFTLAFRATEKAGSGYRLVLRPDKQEAEINGATFRYARKVVLDTSRPISIQAFVQGSIVECFINDAYAFSCRAYNHRQGRLGVSVADGDVKVLSLAVKTPAGRWRINASSANSSYKFSTRGVYWVTE